MRILTWLVATLRIATMHATLVKSEPAAGARVPASPTQVRLVFSEPVEPTLSTLSLVAGTGTTIKLRPANDSHDAHAVIAPVDAPLAPGTYRVQWHVVSADGHPVGGSYVFSVGPESPVAAAPVPPVDTTRAHIEPAAGPGIDIAGAPLMLSVLRAAAVGTTMALAGLLFFFVWCAQPDDAIGRRALRMLTVVAAVAFTLLVLHAFVWMVHIAPEHELSGREMSTILASHVGAVEVWRTGLALFALFALWLARRPGFALAFAVGALMVSGATGHSGAIQPMISAPTKALHLLAGAAWLGGLLWLTGERHADDETLMRDASRVSTVALTAVVLVALSGTLQAFLFLPSIGDLFRSNYGALVISKAIGLVALVGFGAFHRYRVVPRLRLETHGSFQASLWREIGVMCLVLVLGGFLAYVAPPSDAHRVPMTHGSRE